MVDIKWTDDLSVGVDSIDNQHKELIATFSNLLKAIERKDARDEVQKVVDFLRQYVESHFAMEETLMTRIKYPNDKFLEHEAQHTLFWESFNELVEIFKKDHSSPAMINTIEVALIQWFVNHICKTDKAIGVFLRRR
ncbi:MAG: bacteriohemerythrin [Candidatus Magnetobacterium sp. LHC-1]|uniref:Hemerythrin family protein n=1 Tax=Candidatus Magnetobacterium casense TaxID=1455061 RepID=A0ABS6S198_9BACT|nr:bacteriohemerythrin [Candidatus Magnetobacterium casensis]MBF0606127.1 hemerythrin family protein [Nitrospirota bacterium]MBV6342183.1 hemerythrin family protein [Candidatus Magnetobacterium casensis]